MTSSATQLAWWFPNVNMTFTSVPIPTHICRHNLGLEVGTTKLCRCSLSLRNCYVLSSCTRGTPIRLDQVLTSSLCWAHLADVLKQPSSTMVRVLVVFCFLQTTQPTQITSRRERPTNPENKDTWLKTELVVALFA